MKRLLIVGGGSAGWMTAAYLNGALNQRGAAPKVEITLLESPDIPRISVGEATIPSMRHLLSVVGIPEIEFMRAMDDYKRDAGRMFPTCSEVLEVIRSLGYYQLTEEQVDILG